MGTMKIKYLAGVTLPAGGVPRLTCHLALGIPEGAECLCPPKGGEKLDVKG